VVHLLDFCSKKGIILKMSFFPCVQLKILLAPYLTLKKLTFLYLRDLYEWGGILVGNNFLNQKQSVPLNNA
jgi:hypothetical protein